MRPDMVGPRPLARPAMMPMLGTPEWYAPFQTNEIMKADPFNMLSPEVVFGTIYEHGDLQKAETQGTVAGGPKALARKQNLGTAATQKLDIGTAGTMAAHPTVARQSGTIPDFKSARTINTPGHKLAMHEGLLDHHAHEYHRNTVAANDQSLHPDIRAQAKAAATEHLRIGQNAQKVINHYQSQGIKSTEKHHADLVNHYDQNKDNPHYAGGVKHPLQPSGAQLARLHSPKSGDWDKHYGVSPEISHEVHEPPKPRASQPPMASGRVGTVVAKPKPQVPKTQVSQGGQTEVSAAPPTVVTSGEGARMRGVKKALRLDLVTVRRPLNPAKTQ